MKKYIDPAVDEKTVIQREDNENVVSTWEEYYAPELALSAAEIMDIFFDCIFEGVQGA